MTMQKSGTTVKFLFQFDDENWSALYPFDSIRAEAKPAKPLANGITEYEMVVTVDEATKSVLVSANTLGWPKANYKFDLRIEKNGEYIYIPNKTNVEFYVINPVTDGE